MSTTREVRFHDYDLFGDEIEVCAADAPGRKVVHFKFYEGSEDMSPAVARAIAAALVAAADECEGGAA